MSQTSPALMRFSVEILDHIFSFLVSHQSTLFACSKDPVLSPIIERQLFYHTVVGFAPWGLDCCFKPDHLSKLISESPRILKFVRILEFKIERNHSGYQDLEDFEEEEDSQGSEDDLAIQKQLDNFAETLLLFPLLECIMLTTPKRWMWEWPDVFRAALENRLSLPTVKDVHIVGNQEFPFSLIGNCKNIENLFLAGSFRESEETEPTPLRLKSLTLSNIPYSFSAEDLHIKTLQSLKCAESSVDHLSELLEVCSKTLNKLDIDLTHSQYSTNYTFSTGKIDNRPLRDLSPIPPNLHQLTIRAPVLVENEMDVDGIFIPKHCWSYLPAIRDIINSFIPPPKHLVLDINLHLFDFSFNLANVDFSPLEILGAAALSIPCIDLYVHTDTLPSDITLAQLLTSLVNHDDVMRAMEKGILVIHAEMTAPDYVQD